jgi:hypothetical protein
MRNQITKFLRAIRDAAATVIAIVFGWFIFCLCFGHGISYDWARKNPLAESQWVSMIKVTL